MYTPKQTYEKIQGIDQYNKWSARNLAKTVDNLGKAVFAMEYAKQEKTQMYEIVKEAYDDAKSALDFIDSNAQVLHDYLICNEDAKKVED